jgi:pimeloyl-ACP methyl ester carboxylesterase
LIHGAFEDASVWSAVAQELQKDHYRVVVPAVPLEGPESDAAYVAALTGSISGPTVLVGHSYGGLVVSELAKKLPDVVGLVYVAAFIPVAGDSLQSLNTMFKGSLLGPDTVEAVDTPKGPSVDLKPSSYPEIVGKGLPAAALAVGAASQRPLLASAMTEPVLATAPSSIPAFAIVARNDKAIAPEAERFMARRAHAKTTELNSPHAIPLAHAGQVTSVIEKASSK